MAKSSRPVTVRLDVSLIEEACGYASVMGTTLGRLVDRSLRRELESTRKSVGPETIDNALRAFREVRGRLPSEV